ncbi:hypothetical protein C8R47DRAFT_1076588 [Mycena vitilis]|nr:hypothetical protein C8R47DRAFT_1076588 [Mycena vitilis]
MVQSLSLELYEAPNFGRGPPLGVYNTVAVSMLKGRPYDSNWAYVFRTLDLLTLFQLALCSREMCRLVLEYVKENRPAWWHADELIRGSCCSDYLSKIPVELFDFILGDLTTADLINVARVSIDRLLRRFGLTHAEVRFMQSATMAIIAGPGVADFMTADFHPTRVDFFAPNTTYAWVIRFFEMATGYEGWPEEVIHDHPHVLHRTALYRSCTSLFIIVNQSRTDSAMDCVPYLPFTHHMVSLSHLGAWIPYPNSTAAGVSLPNRASLCLNNSRTRDGLYLAIQETVVNYRIAFSLDRTHLCGVCFECPATSRTTGDAGCFELFFPALPLGTGTSMSVYPVGSVMAWSLDGRRCAVGPDVGRTGHSSLRWRDDGYALMELPLLARLEFDKAHGLRHFLVNTQHGIDFAATRDRSTPKGGLWTFKRVDDEIEPDQETRGMLRVFMVTVFGEIEAVHEANGGFVVRLRCPQNVSCRAQTLYYRQIGLLRRTILAEAATAVGFIRACWFAPTVKGVKAPAQDGCFYVQMPAANYNSSVTVGVNAEISVVPVRMQDETEGNPSHIYYMRVSQFRALTPLNLPVKEAGAMATAKYGKDYLPTRECSLDESASLFTFKDSSPSSGEVFGTREMRGYLREFQCVAFGEVVSMEILENGTGVALELQCPTDASCAAVEMYAEQISSLADVLDLDAVQAAGECVGSFFSSPASRVLGDRATKRFWVHVNSFNRGFCERVVKVAKVGKTIDVSVCFERVDRTIKATGHATTRGLNWKFGTSTFDRDRPQRRFMSTLSDPRLCSPLGVYGVDFVPVQASCDDPDNGATYVYKPLADPPDFMYRSIYSHTEQKRSIPPYEFSLQDGKIFVYYVTLGSAGDLNVAAKDLQCKQEADLAHIASVDGVSAIRPFKATFGPASLGDAAARPTAIIIYVFSRIDRRDRLRTVKAGEDVAMNCNLIRVDKVVGDVQHSRYVLVANLVLKLGAGQISHNLSCCNWACIDGRSRMPPVSTSRLLRSLQMLARMQSLGVSTLANAHYGTDYDAVRKCSLDGGCLYLLKKMPEIMEYGTGEYKGRLENYTGHVIGEVDKAFTLAGSHETVLRMKLPGDATCAAVDLFTKQQGALRDIMERDYTLWGGSAKESFFDLSATYPAIACVPNSFYAVFETSPQLTRALKRHSAVIMKVSVSRRDKVNAVTGETERCSVERDRGSPDFFAQTSNGHLSAYLFATGVSEAVKVRVPVTSTTPPTQPSDVNFMIWMATDPNHARTNLCYLEMDVGDEVGFMVFVPDQERPMGRADLLHPVNASLAAQQQPALPQFRGNILVMRRDRRSSAFLDVRQEDLVLAMQCAIGESSMNAREK